MPRLVYLDHSATTPLDPEVLAAMQPVFAELYGNASSVHAFGRSARVKLEESRESIAQVLGVSHDELLFTSGGTESDNFALRGTFAAARQSGRDHLIVSSVEHHAVLATAEKLKGEGASVTVLPVDEYGMVDPERVRSSITPKTFLVSVMHGNNEVGTLEPIHELALLANEHGALFHSDAVQTFGKVRLNLKDTPVDLVSITAHKLYGPKGIGALVVRKGTALVPETVGGAQEGNRRAGTENVPLAVGFAAAVRIAAERRERDAERLVALSGEMKREIGRRFPDLLWNGHPNERLQGIVSISFPWDRYGLDGEALIMGLDLRGVAVTSGSACTSGTLQPSHVLMAMGRDERTARATVRFSLGRATTAEDVKYAAEALEEVVKTASNRV